MSLFLQNVFIRLTLPLAIDGTYDFGSDIVAVILEGDDPLPPQMAIRVIGWSLISE